MATRKMSVGQAIIEFLSHQYTVDGDHRERTIAGVFGIFGAPDIASRQAFFGLFALQHRGQEQTGIVSTDGKKIFFHNT